MSINSNIKHVQLASICSKITSLWFYTKQFTTKKVICWVYYTSKSNNCAWLCEPRAHNRAESNNSQIPVQQQGRGQGQKQQQQKQGRAEQERPRKSVGQGDIRVKGGAARNTNNCDSCVDMLSWSTTGRFKGKNAEQISQAVACVWVRHGRQCGGIIHSSCLSPNFCLDTPLWKAQPVLISSVSTCAFTSESVCHLLGLKWHVTGQPHVLAHVL